MRRIGWPNRAIEDPRQVPELRAALRDMAEPGGDWEQVEIQKSIMNLAGPEGYDQSELWSVMQQVQQAAKSMVGWYRHALPLSQLYHVDGEMMDVVEAAMETLPEDHVLTEEDVAAPYGLAVFGRPVIGIGATHRAERFDGDHFFAGEMELHDLRVDAVSWGPVLLPPKGSRAHESVHESDESIRHGVSFASYRYIDHTMTDDLAMQFNRGEPFHMWLPLGRTDWVWGTPLSEKTYESIHPMVWETMLEDRQLILSLWSLMKQRNIVTHTPVTMDKPARKRMTRAGHEPAPVSVVRLRTNEYRPSGEIEQTGRHLGVRFMVRPHWRHQAYGPNRSLRKLILVPPHIKGPADAPLRHTERVWKVD